MSMKTDESIKPWTARLKTTPSVEFGDAFFLGMLKGVSKVYCARCSKQMIPLPSAASASRNSLRQPSRRSTTTCYPFYSNLNLPVKAALTDNTREFFGTCRHPYEVEK
jgi:hypothetical protein